MNVRVLVYFFVLFVLYCHAFSQDRQLVIDSLMGQLAIVDKEELPEVCFRLAEKYRRIELDSAFRYAKKGLAASVAINNDTATAKAYDILGRVHHGKGQYILASKYFEKGLQKAQAIKNDRLILYMRNSIGVSHATAGQLDKALEYFLDVYETLVKDGKEYHAIQAQVNIASLYSDSKQFDKAISTYEDALKGARKLDKKRQITKCLSGLGDAYEKLGIYDKAFEYQEQSLAFGEENNYIPQILLSLERMGRLWVLKGNIDLGKQYYERALGIAYDENRLPQIQTLLMALGELAIDQGQLPQATDYFTKSLKKAEQMQALGKIEEVELKLSEIYARQNNHQMAYEHAMRYTKLREQIFDEKATLRLGEIEAKYALERNEEEMRQQEEEIERLMELEQNKQMQLYALWAVAVLVVILLITLYSRFRIKQKINEVLSRQNVAIQQKNELLEIKTDEIQAQNQLLEKQSEAIQAQNSKLRQANSDLEQFAYAASHDLREPLRTISSYIDLIKIRYTDQLDTNAMEFIDYASNGAMRMDELLKDLLAYSRIGRRSVLSDAINLDRLVKNVLDDLAMQIHEHNAEIELMELPVVSGYEAELHLLFQNLVNNAIKFRKPAEKPLIQIAAKKTRKFWKISVQDNGIGMNPGYHDKVFTIFQRLHTREEYDGTGIGLAICKKIVENHNGSIWFESEEGKGTTFYVKLPQSLKKLLKD